MVCRFFDYGDAAERRCACAARFQLPPDWLSATGADGLPPHIERTFLRAQSGRIRGVYDASLAHDMVRLKYDLPKLAQFG
ncbi:hypothetical protein V8J88_03690 [Massilia sp. W12]|uniref:hypothetical protein n=1 Tax=Massilia sp. W12 TaxID=3126507 RepID=UPI0030D1CEC1